MTKPNQETFSSLKRKLSGPQPWIQRKREKREKKKKWLCIYKKERLRCFMLPIHQKLKSKCKILQRKPTTLFSCSKLSLCFASAGFRGYKVHNFCSILLCSQQICLLFNSVDSTQKEYSTATNSLTQDKAQRLSTWNHPPPFTIHTLSLVRTTKIHGMSHPHPNKLMRAQQWTTIILIFSCFQSDFSHRNSNMQNPKEYTWKQVRRTNRKNRKSRNEIDEIWNRSSWVDLKWDGESKWGLENKK